MARSAVRSVAIINRTDRQAWDGHCPNGVPPVSVPVIFVAAPPDLSYTAGQSVSQNLASYVTGTDASGYVMSLVAVFGTLAGVGLSLSTTTISGTAVQAGFTYKLRATKGGFTFDAPATSQVVVSPVVVTDTQAPTIPAFPTIVVDTATPKCTPSVDFPMDIRPNPSDRVKVECWKTITTNGVLGTETLLGTVTASVDQPNPVFATGIIGAATPGTVTYSAGNVSFANILDGTYSDSADQVNYCLAPVTWAVGATFSLVLNAPTSGSAYSEVALSIRASLTSMAPSIRLIVRSSGVASPLLYRPSQGAALSYVGDFSISGSAPVRATRLVNDQFRLEHYDAATGQVINTLICTLVMPTLVYFGADCDRVIPGAAMTAAVNQLCFSVAGRASFEDLATPSGFTYGYRFKGKDSATVANSSAFSTSVAGTISPVAGNAIKYHPGDYIWPPPGATPDNYPGDGSLGGISGRRFDMPIHRDAYLAFLDEIAPYPEIIGIQIVADWKALEGDTPGNHTAGFDAMDAILARAVLRGKRVMLSWQTVVFGNFARLSDIFPTYLGNQATPTDATGGYGLTTMTGNDGTEYHGVTARTWQRHTGDRVIAVSNAWAARYNPHPNFEMITMGETALDCQPGLNGFSVDNQETELLRQIPLMRAAWQNTAIRIGANDFHPDDRMNRLLDMCDLHYCGVGGPDIWLGDVTQADRQFAGYNEPDWPNHAVPQPARQQIYTDRRDRIPWAIEVQFQSFSGYNGYFWTLAMLRNGTLNGYTPLNQAFQPNGFAPIVGMKTKYLVWWRNDYAGAQSTWWQTAGTGQRDFIRANPLYPLGTVVAAPSRYPAVNRN
jgi:hypothetical protein